MKITSFNPLIVSSHAEEIIETLEALGFTRKHRKEGIEGTTDKDITSVNMVDANGFRVDVAQADSMSRDLTAIRMNVRDWDEAYEFLTARGFKNAQVDRTSDTPSSRATLMVSPSGFGINLVEHIRK